MAEAKKKTSNRHGGSRNEVRASEDLSKKRHDRRMMTISFKKLKPLHKRGLIGLPKKCAKPSGVNKKLYVMRKAFKANRNKLKQRMQTLDTNYVSEYYNRVSTQMQQAEAALARAIEIGDSQATVEAQRALTGLAIQADRAAQAKAQSARAQQQAQAAGAATSSRSLCLLNSLKGQTLKQSNGL